MTDYCKMTNNPCAHCLPGDCDLRESRDDEDAKGQAGQPRRFNTRFIDNIGFVCSKAKADYLKTWRCWQRKPTADERAATPWDG